jgi:NTE family protein
LLVDGGTLDPVPVEINRGLGADFVIAVDLFGESYNSPKPEERRPERILWPEGIRNAMSYMQSLGGRWFGGFQLSEESKPCKRSAHLIEIIERTLAITQRAITTARLAEHPADFLIRPPVSHVGLLDFHRAEPVIAIGEETMEELMPQLRQALDAHLS